MSETHYSDTRGLILMKPWRYIELTLNWYNVIFSTSVSILDIPGQNDHGGFQDREMKNEEKALTIKTGFPMRYFSTSGFDYWNLWFSKNWPTSGFRLATEVGNSTLHQFRVN